MNASSFQNPPNSPKKGLAAMLALAKMAEWSVCPENKRIRIDIAFIRKLFPEATEEDMDIDKFLSRVDASCRDTVAQRLLNKKLTNAKPFELEFRFNRSDGDVFYFKLYGTDRQDGAGKIIQKYGLIQDVTGLGQTEQIAPKRQQDKNLLIDTIPIGLATWTPERRLVWANKKFLELFDSAPLEKSVNELCYHLLKPSDDIYHKCPVLLALQRKQPITQEMDIASKTLTFSVFPHTDKHGEITRINMAVYDISDFKQQQQHLFDQKKMEAVRSLAAGIVQDFDNLLQTVQRGVQMPGVSSNKISGSLLDKIMETVQRGYGLTHQIRVFSGLDKTFRPQSIAVADFIDRFASNLAQSISAAITVTVRVDKSLPPIFADAESLQNMLDILIANAVAAMEKGGSLGIFASEITLSEQIDIHDRVSRSGRYVRITVTDTGMGIDQAELSRIFNPFLTTKPDYTGLGAGLPLVYAETRRHKGHILANSAPGKGTAISLYFPVPTGQEQAHSDIFSVVSGAFQTHPINILMRV